MISFREKRKWIKERFPLLCQDAYIRTTSIFIWLFLLLFNVNVRRTETFLAVSIVGLFVLLASKYHIEKSVCPNRTTPWILFLLCLVTRLAWCAYMLPRLSQVSDFDVYLKVAAAGNFADPFYFLYPHKAMYPLLLRILGIATQEKALYFQCLCVSCIPPLLYHIGKGIKSERLGLLAALIYLVWPGQFIYITIVTEEHIVALMLVAVTALLLDAYHAICDEDLPSRSIWIKFICAGALCGISAPFRDFAVIFLIAAIIYGFVLVFSQRKGISKRIIVAIAIVLLSRAAANMSLTGLVSYSTGLQMDENIVTAQMYWSLDPGGWGGYDAQRIQEYSDLVEAHDYDFESANHDAMQILIGKIRAAYYKMPGLLLRKGIASYADDGDLFFWSGVSILSQFQSELSCGLSILQFAGGIFYSILVLCLLVCTFSRNKDIFYILLVTVGSIMAGLLIECQGRYKYCVEPIWSVAAAYALCFLTLKARNSVRIREEASVSEKEKTSVEKLRESAQNVRALLLKWMDRRSYTVFSVSAMGIAVGMLALGITAHSCPALLSKVVLQSYFNSGFLLLVNILPSFLLIWVGYSLFHRVWAAYLFSALPTLALAFVNYYKVKLRDDPFYPTDLLLAGTAGGVVDQYSFPITGTVIFAVVCFAAALLWCIFLCKRKGTAKIWQRIGCALLCAVIGWGAFALYTNQQLWEYERYQEPYHDYNPSEYYVVRGIWYPFIYYIQNIFQTAPEGYDSSVARQEFLSYENDKIPEEKKINVVGVMLEAFADLTDFPAVAEQPGVAEIYQPLHDLESHSIHGNLLTDVFGGGTCITEWASLTGSNAYLSFLTDIRRNEDSYVWYLRSQGYHTVYTHPNVKWMYNRQNIIPWLGFEETRFYEDAFEGKVTQTDAMIRSDDLLFNLLLEDVVEHSTQNEEMPLFSFSVSYQNHGAYSASELAWEEVFPEAESGLGHESWVILNNYLGGVSYTIQQITHFVDELESCDEPYVFYLFGDHKPWLGNDLYIYRELGINLDLSTFEGYRNYYSTPYLIWANSAAKEALGKEFVGEGGEFSPCFLMQELFDACGWDGPGFMKISREMRNRSPLISFHNAFLEDGQLTTTLSPGMAEAYEKYLFVQYYRKQHGLETLYS